ncbi:MAG: phasin family protein [Burkholderiaceae bacterium]
MFTPESNPFALIPAQVLDQTLKMSSHSLVAIARLNQLQLQTIKVSFEESGEHLAELVQADSVQAAGDALARWISPGGAKFQSWLGHVQTITSETGTELAKDMEKQIAGNGSSIQSALEATVLEDPAGTQGMFPWMQPANSPVIDSESSGLHGKESITASRRTRSSGTKQVKRRTTRKTASPINF